MFITIRKRALAVLRVLDEAARRIPEEGLAVGPVPTVAEVVNEIHQNYEPGVRHLNQVTRLKKPLESAGLVMLEKHRNTYNHMYLTKRGQELVRKLERNYGVRHEHWPPYVVVENNITGTIKVHVQGSVIELSS